MFILSARKKALISGYEGTFEIRKFVFLYSLHKLKLRVKNTITIGVQEECISLLKIFNGTEIMRAVAIHFVNQARVKL